MRNILKLCIEKIWGNILELQRGDIGKCTVTIQESRDFFYKMYLYWKPAEKGDFRYTAPELREINLCMFLLQ